MQMKTAIERVDIKRGDLITRPPNSTRRRTLLPIAILFAMACAILLMDAVLPLREFWFNEAQLTQLGSWPMLPSTILFPDWPLIWPLLHGEIPQVLQSWEKLPLLLGSFIIVFLVYLLALRRLPGQITRRYLVISTAILGILYMLIPVVTSPDLYSYIAYARIGVIYHMNPLTTLPTAIRSDVIYPYVYWVDQPSAYGPTWTLITSSLQWLTSLFGGAAYTLPMIIALRALGLSMHLASTVLIWSISGHLQRRYGTISNTTRMRATLAFAWNPLLLFEACVNAHVDTTLLPLILLAIWFLARNAGHTENLRAIALAAAMLALATCLKIYIVLFIPGLLIYAWTRAPVQERRKRVAITAAIYAGIILLLYAPFWQGGAIFNVFFVNPATYRSIGSLADFLSHFYNAIVRDLGFPMGTSIGSPAEHLSHTLSLVIFVIIYMLLCWRILRAPQRISTLQSLVRWMALVWLVYCAIGSSWFWPWYITTFLGLFALMEAVPGANDQWFDIALPRIFTGNNFVRLVRLFSFSMLGLYCFFTWGPLHTFLPGLPGFQWSTFSGLWIWVLPLAGTALLLRKARANTANP
jgi:hypothetical protein